MEKSPSSVLEKMLADYEVLARDPSTSSLTRTKLLNEINDYRQLIASGGVSDYDFYEAIKEIFITIQVELHKGNLDSLLVRKLGPVFFRIQDAAEFYVATKGRFSYQIGREILCFPEIVLE